MSNLYNLLYNMVGGHMSASDKTDTVLYNNLTYDFLVIQNNEGFDMV